jgi:hypothetical protein
MRHHTFAPALCALIVIVGGCRTAVVSGPNSSDTKTVVTVHEEPKTQPSDKGLEVIDRR